MSHTPGPWHFCGNHVDDAHGMPLCRTTRSFEDLNPLDFRLIATAPELLEELKFVAEWIDKELVLHVDDCVPSRMAVAERLDRVIAKAEGSGA